MSRWPCWRWATWATRSPCPRTCGRARPLCARASHWRSLSVAAGGATPRRRPPKPGGHYGLLPRGVGTVTVGRETGSLNGNTYSCYHVHVQALSISLEGSTMSRRMNIYYNAVLGALGGLFGWVVLGALIQVESVDGYPGSAIRG